jgi:hypothetical protein
MQPPVSYTLFVCDRRLLNLHPQSQFEFETPGLELVDPLSCSSANFIVC